MLVFHEEVLQAKLKICIQERQGKEAQDKWVQRMKNQQLSKGRVS